MTFSRMPQLAERIIVETDTQPWVTLSSGGSGILAQAMVGKHDESLTATRRTAVDFAYQTIHEIELAAARGPVPGPQILVNIADTVIDDPEHTYIICTTWRVLSNAIEVCSVGTNTVLVFEGDIPRRAIAPQNIHEQFQRQGIVAQESGRGGLPTRVLTSQRSKKRCSTDDVNIISAPLLSTTMVAIIANWRLAEAIMRHTVSRETLFNFIEGWAPSTKETRTSILISF